MTKTDVEVSTKVNNFFEQDDVISEGDPRSGSMVQRQDVLKDYEIEYQFSGSSGSNSDLKVLNYPNDHSVEISQDNIQKIKEEQKDA